MPFRTPDEKEIQRINRLQREKFDDIVHLFDPPLPEGVPERLARIVSSAAIRRDEIVLDVGTGTGILIPLIQKYRPKRIYACDLSRKMLRQLRKNHTGVKTLLSDVRDLTLATASIDVVFINACYPNIADKAGTFENISRMLKPAGRLMISHPLGKRFIKTLRKTASYPLDDFPNKSEARHLLRPYRFEITEFVDEPDLYILLAARQT